MLRGRPLLVPFDSVIARGIVELLNRPLAGNLALFGELLPVFFAENDLIAPVANQIHPLRCPSALGVVGDEWDGFDLRFGRHQLRADVVVVELQDVHLIDRIALLDAEKVIAEAVLLHVQAEMPLDVQGRLQRFELTRLPLPFLPFKDFLIQVEEVAFKGHLHNRVLCHLVGIRTHQGVCIRASQLAEIGEIQQVVVRLATVAKVPAVSAVFTGVRN